MGRKPGYDQEVIRYRADGGLVALGVEIRQPDLMALIDRAKDLRPVWEAQRARYADPDAFIRSDRYRGGFGRADRDGMRRNWGPGYAPYARFGRTKRTFTIRARRPYHPTPTEATVLATIQDTLGYLIGGGR